MEERRLSQSRRCDLWAVFSILALALALRFYDLAGESLWYDEAYSVWTSAMDIVSLPLLWRWQIEFPLYYVLLHFWIKLFGQGEFAVRAFGALVGALTVIPMYHLGKALFGRRAGAIAAILLAVNPYHVWYSQEVRMYACAVLFTLVSVYAFWRLMHRGGWGWWVAHALVTGLTFHLHYYIGWMVLAENLFYIWWLWRGKGGISRQRIWLKLRRWIIDQCVVLLLALPAFAVFLTKLLARNQWGWLAERYGTPGLSDLVGLFVTYILGSAFPGSSRLSLIISAFIGGLAAWGALALLRLKSDLGDERDQGREALYWVLLGLVLPISLTFLVGQYASIWVPRYLLLFLPSFLLLVALGVRAMPSKLALGATLILLGISFYSLSGMYGAQQKEDWRGVANYLAMHVASDDLVVLMDEECRVPLAYYYGDAPVDIEISRFADDATLDAAVAEVREKQRGGRLWLVVSHADSGELEERLDVVPGLSSVEVPDYVGIKLVRYVWS